MSDLLTVSDLGVVYKGKTELRVLESINLSVKQGTFVSIVGPSGCGKTTLLRCVSGLQTPTTGQIRISDVPVTGPPEGMTLVFQEYNRSLFPWRSIMKNVMLPLEGRVSGDEAKERASKLLEELGLRGFENYYPWQLSGGMQQRVAIARALAPNPKILLMDEPFASVDAQTRTALEDQLLSVWNKLGLTILFVTHDIEESIYLAEQVIVLSTRPTRIIDEVETDLAYPRDQIVTRSDQRFMTCRARILEEFRKLQKSSVGPET
ncbi:MAG: ABC transporter ATP-binding protein [Thaumarchaeota archaeon]|nr:ABC transporter ATP-binding protein [Nitrososphaerota archaeon]